MSNAIVFTEFGQGLPGPPSLTQTTAPFTQPAASATVQVAVGNATWMFVGMPVVVQGGGAYTIAALSGSLVTLTNTGANGNAAQGTVVAAGALLAPNGFTGPTGPVGPTSGTTTAQFTMPAPDGTTAVTIQGTPTTFLASGQKVFVVGAGYLKLNATPGATSFTAVNQGDAGNVAQGTVVALGAVYVAAGATGGVAPALGTTAANFTMPAADGVTTVTISGSPTSFLANGQKVFVQGAGYLKVSAPPGLSSFVAVNQGDTGNAAPTTVINAGAAFSAAGATGATASTSTTTTASFTMPTANGVTQATLTVANTGFMVQGQWLYVTGAGYVQVAGAPTSTTAPVVNQPGISGNALPGSVVSSGASVVPGGSSPPNPIIGTSKVGLNTTVYEQGFDETACPAGVSTLVYTLPAPNVAFNESVEMGVEFAFRDQATSQKTGRMTRLSFLTNTPSGGTGIFASPTGLTTDADVTPNAIDGMNSGLAGLTASIQQSGNTIGVYVTPPGGVAIYAAGRVSVARFLAPGTGPLPTITGLSVTHGPGTGNTQFTITGSGFTGGVTVQIGSLSTGYVACSVNAPTDDAHVTAFSGQWLDLPGAYDVIVTNLNGTATLAGGWTYDTTAATPLTIFPTSDPTRVLKFFGDGTTLQHTGTSLTAWNDKSGLGNNLPIAAGTPQYNSSSASITPAGPTVDTLGTAVIGSATALAWTTSAGEFIFSVCRPKTTTAQVLINVHQELQFSQNGAGKYDLQTPDVTFLSWGNVTTNTTSLVWAFYDDYTESTGLGLSELSVDNATPVSHLGNNVGHSVSPSPFFIGGRNATTFLANAEFAAVGVVMCTNTGAAGMPTTKQLALLHAWAQATYGMP